MVFKRIKELRKILGLTQTEFAKKVGVSLRGMQRWEHGDGIIPERTLLQLESTFKLSPQWLREGEGEMLLVDEAYRKTREDLGIKRNTDVPSVSIKKFMDHYLKNPEHIEAESNRSEELIVAVFRELSLENKLEILRCLNRMRIVEEVESKPIKGKKRA